MNSLKAKSFVMLAASELALCAAALMAQTSNQASPTPSAMASACAGLPPGKHVQLERMAQLFSLTCEQELKIEPLLHNEESVSKPLLRFQAFSPEEKQGVMLKIKLAARRQIRTLLNPDQQKKMDEEIESLATSGGKPGGGGKKKVSDSDLNLDPFEREETLSQAILNYSALTEDEQRAMALEVKTAARRNESSQFTPDQLAKLDAEIRQLSSSRKM